ncbi:MAG: hypothetical protein IPJ84_00125 [Bdellovibrionales bacterium]|nr:hypothetical protein [Bdellovibrionales bacterium]
MKRAFLRDGTQSGGSLTTLIFDRKQDSTSFFASKTEWSVAVQTDWGIIPTLFTIKPKEHNRNQHTRIHKRIVELPEDHIPPKICANFDRKNSLFDIIKHYAPEWKISRGPSKNIAFEADVSFLMLEDRFSNRGLLVLYDPKKNMPLKRLGVNASIVNEAVIDSVLYHVAKLSLYENAKSFVSSWQDYTSAASEESYLEQKRDDLERIGFACCFRRRKGVDSPASTVRIQTKNSVIEFNIDVELKHDAKRFFNKNEAKDIRKYPRLPTLILANTDTSKESEIQQILHPTLSLETLLKRVQDRMIDALPLVHSAEQEIERLNQIVLAESMDIKKLGKRGSRKNSKKRAS